MADKADTTQVTEAPKDKSLIRFVVETFINDIHVNTSSIIVLTCVVLAALRPEKQDEYFKILEVASTYLIGASSKRK